MAAVTVDSSLPDPPFEVEDQFEDEDQSRDNHDRVREALEALGFADPTPDMVAQFMIFANAFYIYFSKNGQYGGAWRRLGALNNLTRMSTKVERLLEMFWHQERFRTPAGMDLDDVFDLINYSAFFVRQAMQGQWTRG